MSAPEDDEELIHPFDAHAQRADDGCGGVGGRGRDG